MSKAEKSYLFGFIISLLLTGVSFGAVSLHLLPSSELLYGVVLLALIQFTSQLLFFLHMGQEGKPHFNLAILLSTLGVVFIVVIGSLWIMTHLNYNMSPEQISNYLNSQSGY